MQFDPILPPARGASLRAAGLWRDKLLIDYLDENVAAAPDAVAIIDRNSASGRLTSFSWRQLRRIGDRIALGLHALGVRPGDVVAFQLPNWWEFVALHLACLRLGACSNPLMPIFRERELEFMLGLSEAKVMVVPRWFRGHEYAAMMAELKPRLPHLEHVLVVDGRGPASFENMLLRRRWEDVLDGEAIFAACRPSPDDVIQLLYTSGTTGEPKGVMHTSNTLVCMVEAFIAHIGLEAGTSVLMGSPLAHQTGFLYGPMLSCMLRAKLVLLDIWDAEIAARLIQDEALAFTMGATPFLADLTGTPALAKYDISSLKTFVSAGAPIPPVLVERAREVLPDAFVHAGWGMTENGLATATRRSDTAEKVFQTDGCPFPGNELRIVDPDGEAVARGTEGRLLIRSASNFVGYLKRPEIYGVDAEGWFDTGDLGRLDDDGFVRITGRAKDIIIRGGENVPVVEVEQCLYLHSAIAEVAVVGMPDERLGERGCAFVVLKAGERLDFAEMVAFLRAQRMATTYLPERLEIVDALPRTPSGKIQKFRLREMARDLVTETEG